MIGLRANSSANQPTSEGGSVGSDPIGLDMDDLRLGDVMRGERATLGKSLLDVQRELRIRAGYVAAIENCDVTAFDAPSFIAGYVRSYAKYLGMDPDWTFRRFCEESGFRPTHGMAPAAVGAKPARRMQDPNEALANPKALFIPQPESFWSDLEPRAIGSLFVLVLLMAGLGYAGWSVLQEVQRVTLAPPDQSPAVVAVLDPSQEASASDTEDGELALAALPQPEGIDRTFRPATLDVPVLTPRDTPIAAIDPGLPTATPEKQDRALAMAFGPQRPDADDGAILRQADAGDANAVRTVAPDAAEVEILAARPAWVRVTAADGTVLLEKTLDAGERFALPKLETPPSLRAGNSGAVYFAVNGQAYGPAAPGAQVVKKIELSPEALMARYTLADLGKDSDLANMVAMLAP